MLTDFLVKMTSLLQDVEKMQQAGKIDNAQKVYGVLAVYDIGKLDIFTTVKTNGNQALGKTYFSLAICFHSIQRVGKKIRFVF